MFDNYVFLENSCKNFSDGKSLRGFELETLITYYRGIPLSMVYDIAIEVDGLAVAQEALRLSTDGKEWFTIKEAETAIHVKWEFGEPLKIRAYVEGGLRKGEHDVQLSLAVFPAYYPMPAGGRRQRKVTIT